MLNFAFHARRLARPCPRRADPSVQRTVPTSLAARPLGGGKGIFLAHHRDWSRALLMVDAEYSPLQAENDVFRKRQYEMLASAS